jgi:hypothetical protein
MFADVESVGVSVAPRQRVESAGDFRATLKHRHPNRRFQLSLSAFHRELVKPREARTILEHPTGRKQQSGCNCSAGLGRVLFKKAPMRIVVRCACLA